jgi:sec-independent protein translocase protein TatA
MEIDMGGISIWHWLVVGVLVLLLFGKGRFSEMMGDVAKGVKNFKAGLSDDDAAAAAQATPAAPAQPAARIDSPATTIPTVEGEPVTTSDRPA